MFDEGSSYTICETDWHKYISKMAPNALSPVCMWHAVYEKALLDIDGDKKVMQKWAVFVRCEVTQLHIHWAWACVRLVILLLNEEMIE